MERTIIEQAKQLLQSTGAILEKHEEIARLKGENFNVFQLLRIEHREDELHSRFIAELLDPNGSHDQGTVFLKMFLEQVVDPLPPDCFPKECKARPDENRARVYREYYIGEVNIAGDESTGGRIDIFITDDTRHISIENKIYAGEGEHQVTRYCNYQRDRNLVLFLTRRGDKAKVSAGKKYCPISYQDHILPWLESCQKHCADLPILRETIKQYIITIKGLTGGLTMQKMNEDLKQLMQENIGAAHAIYSNYDLVCKKIVDKLVQEIRKDIKSKKPVSSSPDDWEIKIYNFRLSIRNIQWIDLRKTESEDHHLRIELGYYHHNTRLHYGIVANEDHFDRKKIKKKLDGIEEYVKQFNKDAEIAFWDFYWDFYQKEGSLFLNHLKKLLKEEEREELVKDIVNKLIELINLCDSKLLPEDSR